MPGVPVSLLFNHDADYGIIVNGRWRDGSNRRHSPKNICNIHGRGRLCGSLPELRRGGGKKSESVAAEGRPLAGESSLRLTGGRRISFSGDHSPESGPLRRRGRARLRKMEDFGKSPVIVRATALKGGPTDSPSAPNRRGESMDFWLRISDRRIFSCPHQDGLPPPLVSDHLLSWGGSQVLGFSSLPPFLRRRRPPESSGFLLLRRAAWSSGEPSHLLFFLRRPWRHPTTPFSRQWPWQLSPPRPISRLCPSAPYLKSSPLPCSCGRMPGIAERRGRGAGPGARRLWRRPWLGPAGWRLLLMRNPRFLSLLGRRSSASS